MELRRDIALLFGPQSSDIEEGLFCIRDYVSTHPSASYLIDIVRQLPSLWPAVTNHCPALAQLPGRAQLIALRDFFDGGDPPSSAEPMNIIATPVTVIRHIVEYCKLKESTKGLQIRDVQGFCVGFLAATAVSSSKTEDEFRATVSAVIRLAVCIGGLIDSDELTSSPARSIVVRWKADKDYEKLKETLASREGAYISCVTDTNRATLTVSKHQAQGVIQDLANHGISVRWIPLCGRFHTPRHEAGTRQIMELCAADSRFRLPDSTSLILPLRSNVNGQVLRAGSLHEIALQSILEFQSQWVATVSEMLKTMSTQHKDIRLVSIGPDQCVPRVARSRLIPELNGVKMQPNGNATPSDTSSPVDNCSADEKYEARVAHGQPIAIIGMGCRYPQADSVEELWDMLELGKGAVKPLPEERLKMVQLLREPKGQFWGNYLEEPDMFDHRFFGISAREAATMDPQQRLLLQVAYESMESTGYCGLRRAGFPKDIGCYVGVGSDDYTDNVGSHHANAYSAPGTLQAFNTGRISHYFGWSGPSVVVDTACSSAAVAIHLACQALHTKDCSVAVAGGVNVMTSPKVTQNLAAASFLSPTGASKAFDADADGYCRGEGAGLVVLRPLEDAVRCGDSILAVITGTSVNQGDNCSPITVPVSESQRSLYRKALSASGIGPEEVTYVEAHGTGTQVGDPIEFDSIRRTFGGPHRTEELYVGSIKDNVGHTETSSGVAGLIKTILMMQKRRIPKQANFSRLNPKIPPLDGDMITIPKQSTDWNSSKRIAMVTNYGAAGSNAAIVLCEHTPPVSIGKSRPSDAPIFIAAQSVESVKAYCHSLQGYVKQRLSPQPSTISDIAYNLSLKQNRDLDFFVTFPTVCNGSENLLNQLEFVASGVVDVKKRTSKDASVVLCFGGQNGSTAHISQELVSSCKLLQTHLEDCEHVCQALGLPSLFPTIFQTEPIQDLVNLHCILFAIQYASAKSWIDSGLQVDRIIGHSFGQLTGLCVAGGLTLLDGIRLVSQRARLMQTSWTGEHGIMLSVEATEGEIRDLIARVDNSVDVACVNGPRSYVIAGDETSIGVVEGLASGFRTQRLPNTHAFHSRLIDCIVPGLQKVAESLDLQPTTIPVEACSEDGNWTSVTPNDIVAHSRRPVYFSAAVQRVASQLSGTTVWLEAGSASPVIPMVRRVVEGSSSAPGSHIYQQMDLRGSQAPANLAKATSSLWANGVPVQFWPFHSPQAEAFESINLPPYQFAKNSHWTDYDPSAFLPSPAPVVEAPTERAGLVQVLEKRHGECLFAINPKDPMYQTCTSGHAVVDQNLCPASMYLEMVIRAASSLCTTELRETLPNVEGLSISSPLVLNPEGDVRLSLSQPAADKNQWTFSLFTQQGPKTTVTHASGSVSLYPTNIPSTIVTRFRSLNRLMDMTRPDSIQTSSESSGLKGSTVYQAFRRVVNYAGYYQGVDSVFARGHEATGKVIVKASLTKDSACDPILIDNFVQVAGIHVNCMAGVPDDEVYVCTAVGELFIGEAFMRRDTTASAPWRVYSNYDRLSKTQVACDVFVMDEQSGQLALAVMAASFTSVSIRTLTRALAKLNGQQPAVVAVNGSLPSRDNKELDLAPRDVLPQAASPSPAGEGGLLAVQTLLGDLLGVGLDELAPSSSLADIGVDSLMSTEVLTEIKKKFNVDITSEALAEIEDIKGLVQAIFPGTSVQQSATDSISPGHTAPAPPTVSNGITPSDSSIMLAQEAHDLFSTIRDTVSHTKATKWTGFCESVFPKQMALVTAYVVEAFRALGHPLETLQPGQTVPLIPVLPQHEKVRSQLYDVLEFSKLISRTNAGIYRTEQPIPSVAALTLHEEIIAQYPHHASEHTLLRTTGSKLAECLSGKANPLAILFQDAEARRLMGDVYTNAPMFKSATMHLAQYLQDLLIRLKPNRDIKILEIGAGTGGTTNHLVKQLSSVPGLRFEYTFTDISSGLVTLAKKRFEEYKFMRFATVNIEKEPPQELLGQYDIILSTNCVHATRDITHSCSIIRKMLRPDGILCLVELTRNLFWFDLVFGLLEGWWLFNDGRKHALASEERWNTTLQNAGYQWVDWSRNDSPESEILRVIVSSPTRPQMAPSPVSVGSAALTRQETIQFDEKDGIQLLADIYYPSKLDDTNRRRPIALLIHGGGHVMLSRKDIRPPQTKMLLDAGFLPVSIDYRLCPETSLTEGPMKDTRDALAWARQTLPRLALQRPDIRPDGDQVVAVGWSTGGHLAMTLGWTAAERGIRAPEAILAFYCPTDYSDPFWTQPNRPYGLPPDETGETIFEAMRDTPITSYNPPGDKNALGGWMAPSDPRSRIALHMNWKGLTLPVLLHAWKHKTLEAKKGEMVLPKPTPREIESICPTAQINAGNYRTPTYIIHGSMDDLIPLEQVRRTYARMTGKGIDAELRVLENTVHLFDVAPGYSSNTQEVQAVADGYRFLSEHVQL